METRAKLTLSVKRSTIIRGKEYAARQRTTLSRLCEEFIDEKTRSEQPLWASKWRGKLKKAHRPNDPRMRALERKYG